MSDVPVPGSPAFVEAQRLAARHGHMSYAQRRSYLERRYTVMPKWYWDEALSRAEYIAYVYSSIDWQRAQEDANRTSVAMVNELFGRFTR